MNLPDLYQLYLQHLSIYTDTRVLQKGGLYFALKGPHFNGNAFAEQALKKGAAHAIIDEAVYHTDERMILVEDVLATLQLLARYHRDQFHIPFIAITGSNGKTTTKELVNAVLGSTYKVYATEGNLNNHIGIPLTLLRIRPDTEIAVIEMGANHQHEIESYCRIVNPTHGLITNIGRAHLEGFGGIEGVRKGKGELFDYLRATMGSAFACIDFDYFKEMTQGIGEITWYGTQKNTKVTGNVVRNTSNPYLKAYTNYTGNIQTQLAGSYNIYNILAAVAIGRYFKVPSEKITVAIENYVPSNQRSQIIRQGSNTILLDAYNANPSSMKAAIENFSTMEGAHKILLLGAMMELGRESLSEHQALVSLIEKYAWDSVALVGGDFKEVKHPFHYFPDSSAAKEWLQQQKPENTLILIKGSRSIAMEKILT